MNITGLGGRRVLSMKMLSSGSSGSLLLRQTFKADDSLHSWKPTANTERKRTTRRLGAVLTHEPAAVTEDVIRHSCLLFTVMMLLISGLPVECDGISDSDVAVADCCYNM
jgi:hypothetical protein